MFWLNDHVKKVTHYQGWCITKRVWSWYQGIKCYCSLCSRAHVIYMYVFVFAYRRLLQFVNVESGHAVFYERAVERAVALKISLVDQSKSSLILCVRLTYFFLAWENLSVIVAKFIISTQTHILVAMHFCWMCVQMIM